MLSMKSISFLTIWCCCTFSSAATSSLGDTATQSIQSIIDDITTWQQDSASTRRLRRPFVTVTYAQSLDGKIALLLKGQSSSNDNNNDNAKEEGRYNQHHQQKTSSNFALSDPESLRMTHALRSIHDGILIGGKTLEIDNPRLNNRLWKQQPNTNPNYQPRPIVLDTNLNHIQKFSKGNIARRAQNVLICCSQEAAAAANAERTNEDEGDLPELLPCPVNPESGRIDLDYLLLELKTKHGINSIMVEGGASVLAAFYSRPELVDCLCVTTAPKLLFWNGLTAISKPSCTTSPDHIILDSTSFDCTKFILLGKDAVFLAKLK